MRALNALFQIVASEVVKNKDPVKSQAMRIGALMLAEDAGIEDGMNCRNIPVLLALNTNLAGAWAYGYEIGRERLAASGLGLSESASTQTVCVRRVA